MCMYVPHERQQDTEGRVRDGNAGVAAGRLALKHTRTHFATHLRSNSKSLALYPGGSGKGSEFEVFLVRQER